MINSQNLKNSKGLQWLIGFIEAESAFYVSKRKSYGVEGFYVTFSIYQPLKKAQILYYIKRLFGCGHVRITKVDETESSLRTRWNDSRSILLKPELLGSSISTYYITNKKHLSCILSLLERSFCSTDEDLKGGFRTFKSYDFERAFGALTILENKGHLHLTEDMAEALKKWKDKSVFRSTNVVRDLWCSSNSWLKFSNDSSFEDWFTGFTDGGGTFIINFKFRAKYEMRWDRFGFNSQIKLSSRSMNAGLKSGKEIILSFVIAQRLKLVCLRAAQREIWGPSQFKI
uniref:Putative homing endonuclease n=1 Tax=Leiopathes glaberrima TaxID=664727 RepID=D2DM79_9CNID|nr:putative homing endonuclease [Leiopathes glaberrima]